MLRLSILKLLLVIIVVLAIAAPARAGGWAVVTLDQLPAQVVAGEPLTIGFMVRQHGRTPVDGLTPRVTATRAGINESFTVTAKPQGDIGHYAAALAFPGTGTWNWTIDAFGFAQPMPPLTVVAAASSSSAGAGASSPLVSMRTRSRWALALVAVAALVSVTGFVPAAGEGARVAPLVGQPISSEFGQALFVAKGCVVCHQHEAVREARKEFAGFSVGPNLTQRELGPEYLRRWLKDPSAIKPRTEMPTLDLSDDEIEALVAFLTTSR
ncbi:MAG TPA: c-type cytochrome [Anaerolineae bacterium]|nr:c-type cytochrome [Anaerolineae bacterium]